jgi:hypothetical protein
MAMAVSERVLMCFSLVALRAPTEHMPARLGTA